MRILALTLVAAISGCGHVSLNQAIVGHNVFRQMLLDASDAYSAVYIAISSQTAPAEYDKKMKPYDDVGYALRAAQQAEVTLNVVLAQCVSANDETCDGARIGFACAASALDLLSTSYGQIRGGASLYAATAIAKAQLTELASGATCEVSHGNL